MRPHAFRASLGATVAAVLFTFTAQPRPHAAESASNVTARASSEVAGYTDTDAVHVASPTVAGSVADETAGWSVSGRYLVDAVSAASVDIVSTASGHWFEYRHVGSGGIDYKTGPVSLTASGGVSREPDYLSIGTGVSASVELMDKNVVPSILLSYGHDDVGRTGQPKDRWQLMQKVGGQLGVTFVVNRATIAALALDGTFERGYLAKPYRYIPLFAPGGASRIGPGASVAHVNLNRLPERPIDFVPDARDRFALSGKVAHRLDGATIRVDQRLYRDSWALLASTTDGRVIFDVGRRLELWPHLRFHAQKAVSFWQRAYEASPGPEGTYGIPRFRTGDRELGSLVTVTGGAGARLLLGPGSSPPWAITFQIDGVLTRYFDALYLTERRALFSALGVEATF